MQKKHIYILMAIVSLLVLYGCGGGGGGSIPTSKCTDSDGGINYNTSGYVLVTYKGVNTTYTDYCITSSTVGEYYCYNTYSSAYNKYNCPSGQCVNWACTSPISTTMCKDSDGSNYLVRGQVNLTDTQTGQTQIFVDSCLDSASVNEEICETATTHKTLITPCGSGYSCSNGACVASGDSCSDSDGGIYTNVFGTISGVYWGSPYSVNDYCYSSVIVAEGYCSGNTASNQLVRCPMNQTCQGGVCG